MIMVSISKDIEYETPSGHIWEITAEATVQGAEPDVGVMGSWIDAVRLYWTKTGKELSKAAYDRIPVCMKRSIEEELLQAHSDSL